jgi:RNA polymerase sigma factor (sigma-70 family)
VEGRPLDEHLLIERARRGDEEAYAELVHAYEGIAFRTAYLLTRSAPDAEDAAQDAFVKAWRALGRFREGAPFRPWLLRIVANEAHNRRRFAGRRAKIVMRDKVDGQGFFRGTLRGVEGADVLIDAEDGRPHRVPLGIITRANLEVEF